MQLGKLARCQVTSYKLAECQVTWPELGTVPSHVTNFGNLPNESRDIGAGTSLPPLAYRLYHNTSSVSE